MASSPTSDPPLPPVKLDPLAAALSFLIPGLGQVYQGRVGKGLLFFFGLYLLFFYGMWMGQWRNVWIPDTSNLPAQQLGGGNLSGVTKSLWYRPQFLGQFWIGIAAWPAVYQYAVYDPDAKAGPIFGTFEREPKEDELNELQRNGNKRWDLGWVYTVIAGVLNLLVIYDAFAGPMFREPLRRSEEEEEMEAAKTPNAAKPVKPASPAVPVQAPAAAAPPPVPPPAVPAPQQGGA
jgi:hypothetical protein